MNRGVCTGENGTGPTSRLLWMLVLPKLKSAGYLCLKVLSGHKEWVRAVKLSKEGNQAYLVSDDRILRYRSWGYVNAYKQRPGIMGGG